MRLREMGQPICLFGEGPAERRDRLRDFLSRIDDNTLSKLNMDRENEDGSDMDEVDEHEVWVLPRMPRAPRCPFGGR